MKKLGTVLSLIALALALSACARSATICGTTYQPYGLLNSDDKKNSDIEYDVVWGNVFWGAVLAETIIAPIYFGGFSLFEPVGVRSKVKGAVGGPNECPKST